MIMVGYANKRRCVEQVTQAIEDVTEVKRALEAAQGEKKDLQDRFEQREALIRTSTCIRFTCRGVHTPMC
jgi:endonuclease IV